MDWTTASERQADFFAIERSTDQQNWQALGQITAKGQSSTPQSYRFEDAQPQTGRNYYRIRQVDFNGAMDYSSIVQVYLEEREVTIYPNPASSVLSLTLPPGQWSATLFDLQGHEILRSEQPREGLNLQDIPSGSYILRLKNERGEYLSRKVLRK